MNDKRLWRIVVHLNLFLFVIACAPKIEPVNTGCWTGIKDGKRQLIQCMTPAQVVSAEQSSSWEFILAQYSQLQYDGNKTCQQCQQKYP